MKLEKGKIYQIKWTDTFSKTNWWSEDEIKEKCKEHQAWIETVGFFVMKYCGFIVISANIDANVDDEVYYGHVVWIPIGSIKEIKKQ